VTIDEVKTALWGLALEAAKLGCAILRAKLYRLRKVHSYEQAAEFYQVPRGTLVEKVNQGALKAIKFGNNFIRLREEEIDRWLKSEERVQ
jgi:excisionase family DNA binding protein